MGLYDCDECGSPRVNTPSGSACPNGCGKLHGKIPTSAMKINAAILAGVPFAHINRGKYTIDGLDGIFESGRIFTKAVSRISETDDVVAIDGDRLRIFSPAT